MREPIYRDSHFYTLLALFAVCAVLYYFGELVILFGWEALRWDIFYTVHDPHRMLFLGPIIYASLYFRLKGAIAANVLSLIIFLPRAFLISPYPDATLRMLIFVLVAGVLSMFSVIIVRQRDRRITLIAALKHSEEKNRLVLEQMYDSYYEMDLKGKYVFVNDSVCRSMGYLREELVGNDFRFTVHKDDIKRVRDAFSEVFRTGEPNKSFEHKIICKDGSIMVVESSISLRRNNHGEVVGFRSISRDITERKKAVDEIRLRETNLQSLVTILQYNSVSVQDFLDNALNEAIKLTGSKIGYIYYFDENTKEFTLNTWSKGVMDECTIAEKKTLYHLDKTGIWGETVRQRKPIVVNDFQSPHPLKKGYPEGHAKLYKYLTVPVIVEDRIVAVVGVANKGPDYTQMDILQLTLLMDTVWKAVHGKQVEAELRQSEELYRSLFENMLNGFAYCKMIFEQGKAKDFIYLRVNNAFEKQTGLKDVTGKKVSEVIPGIQESDPQLIETYGNVALSGIPQILETYLAALDMWFSIAIYSPQKEHFVAVFDVITERKKAEEGLRSAEEKYRTLVENINDVFYSLDSQGNITYVSPVVEQLTQYKVKDLIGKPFTPLIYPDDLPALLESLNRLVSGQLEPWEFRIVDKDGRIIFVRTSSKPILENGKIVGITALMTDITERKKAEEALRSAEEKYRTLVENINDIFYMLDNKGNITYISPVVERLTLYKVNELIGKPVFPLIHPDDLSGLLESVNQLVSGQLVPWEFRVLDKDGRVIYVRSSRQLLYKDGDVAGITAVMSDITERKKMEQKLEEMAMHDNLTGLPNRVLLADRFKIAAALARRNKGRFAVMSLDLDKFKTVNDTLGHDAGDQVLKTISKRITGIIRGSDTLARVGGDEFILLMQETNHLQDSAAIAQKVLDSFAERLAIDGHNVELSTSIGIAVYPEDGEELATLVKKSDAAMYYSKGHGRNRYKFFGEGDVQISGDHKSAKG